MYRSPRFQKKKDDPPQIELSDRQLQLLDRKGSAQPFESRSNVVGAKQQKKKDPSVIMDETEHKSQIKTLRSILGGSSSVASSSSAKSKSPRKALTNFLKKSNTTDSIKKNSKEQWRKKHHPDHNKPRETTEATVHTKPTNTTIEATTSTSSEFDAVFLDLQKEFSAPYSELYGSFCDAFNVSTPSSVPKHKKLPKGTVQTVQRMHTKLLKHSVPNTGDSFLVNDKRYRREVAKRKAKPTRTEVPAPVNADNDKYMDIQPSDTASTTLSGSQPSVATGATASKPIRLEEPSSSSGISDNSQKGFLSIRTSVESALPSSPQRRHAPTNSYAKDKVTQKHQGFRGLRTAIDRPSDTMSREQAAANVQSALASRFGDKPDTLSREQAAANVDSVLAKLRPATSRVVPPPPASFSTGTKSPLWKRITLKPVSRLNRDVPTKPVAVLDNVDDEPANESTTNEATATENEPAPEVSEKEDSTTDATEDDSASVVEIPLRNGKVFVGKSTIRYTGNLGIWNVHRDNMKPDGMTLQMHLLKVTILMQNGSHKTLDFDAPEHILKFATLFYHDAPPVSEVTDSNTSVNSSVREALTDEEQTVLDKYRELRQTQNSSQALKEVLPVNRASVSNQVKSLDAALGNASLPSEVEADLPSSPISTFTSSSVGAKATDHSLTAQEEADAEKYRLMLRRGVPADAVRHRLTKDQVDVKIVAAVFDDPPAPTPVEEPPKAAPRKSNLSEKEEEVASKYRRMLKMRIPADAVRHKMKQEQVDNKIVAAVLGDQPSTLERPSSPAASSVLAKKRKNTLTAEEESIASEYRKYLRLQIPRDHLLARMRQENVSDKIIHSVLGVSASSENDELKTSSSNSAGSNLINLHWNAIDDAPVGSVWAASQTTKVEDAKLDVAKLASLFERKKTTRKEPKQTETHIGTGKAKLLDLTRSNNIAISLKAFKEFSFKELADIIAFLDPLEKVKGDRSQFIRDLLPTATEAKSIENFTGSDDRLIPAELWFRQLTGIKRIETKAMVLRTMEMYVTEVSGVKSSFDLLNRVCSQVMESSKLQELLGMVLKIGNIMNEGTRTGGAAGFRFDSLLRLTQTKTSDGKLTVLDYLVTVFAEANKRETLSLSTDFPDVHSASRLLISDMTNEVTALKDALDKCKKELEDLEQDLNPPKPKPKAPAIAAGGDPRAALFASIAARGDGEIESKAPKSAGFAKRDQFLAAIQTQKEATPKQKPLSEKEAPSDSDAPMTPSPGKPRRENNVKGGVERLKGFVVTAEASFSELSSLRSETLQTCRDLARYCGEMGGVGSVTMLLDVLSQFAKNIDSAVKKHDDRQILEARKRKSRMSSATTKLTPTKQQPSKNSKSLVLLVNDVLQNANPRFKEDFKKGRVLANPSNTLQAIYEREKQLSSDQRVSMDNKITSSQPAIRSSDDAQTTTPLTPSQETSVVAERTTQTGPSRNMVASKDAGSRGSRDSKVAAPDNNLSSLQAIPFNTRIEDHSGSTVAMSSSPTIKDEPSQAPRTSLSKLRSSVEALRNPPIGSQGEAPAVEAVLVESNSSSSESNQVDNKKSIADKARERRQEKATIGDRRPSSPAESNTARLARIKRLQKRMSR